jgi:hypothetical protein
MEMNKTPNKNEWRHFPHAPSQDPGPNISKYVEGRRGERAILNLK